MSTPLVSVIIPTHNRARYLGLAIDSVLKQTFDDYEVIVIDDGSTDGTRDVVREYGGSVRYLHQENSGVGAARNAGIEAAKGEWITFLDDDDEWLPGYLAFQTASALQNPAACMHMTNSQEVFPDGTRTNTFQVKNIAAIFQEGSPCVVIERPVQFIVENHITALQSTMMRRQSIIKAGLFDPRLRIAEDLDLIARVGFDGPLGISDMVLALIHRRNEPYENCLSSQIFSNRIYTRECFISVYEKILHNPGINNQEKLAVEKILIRQKRDLGNLLFEDGRPNEAREWYRKSMLIKPTGRSFLRYLISYLPGPFIRWPLRRFARSSRRLGPLPR